MGPGSHSLETSPIPFFGAGMGWFPIAWALVTQVTPCSPCSWVHSSVLSDTSWSLHFTMQKRQPQGSSVRCVSKPKRGVG